MKKGMFTGWKDVFRFTFEQNVKTKSFKTAIVGISLLIFIIFFAINMGVGYYKDSKKPKKQMENEVTSLYIYNDTRMEDEMLLSFVQDYEFASELNISIVEKKEDIEQNIADAEEQKEKVMSVAITETVEEELTYELLFDQSEECSKSNVERIAEDFAEYFEECKLMSAGIDESKMLVVMSEVYANTMDIEEADKSLGEILLGIFMPMITTLIIYMLVLMHGQSISKIIVVEKNSKLMETLLISVKPYAIILGKILAMYVVAIIQMAAWVVSGVAGYIVGDKLAGSMFEKYENPVSMLINLVRDNAQQAFSAQAVIICILSVLVGFLTYCVLAGLITSNITKAEDLANGTSVYQIIVVIGFLLAYMLPLLKQGSPIIDVLRYVPITSVFMLPADILMGSISAVGAILSICILLVTTSVMIILTGKIYKKKVF